MHVVTQRNCLKILVKVKSRLLLPSCTENSFLYNVKNSNAEKCLLIKIYYMNKRWPYSHQLRLQVTIKITVLIPRFNHETKVVYINVVHMFILFLIFIKTFFSYLFKNYIKFIAVSQLLSLNGSIYINVNLTIFIQFHACKIKRGMQIIIVLTQNKLSLCKSIYHKKYKS